MARINLRSTRLFSDTVVPNKFIDEYMPEANGEFVKIYLYLLKELSSNESDLSISHIADLFNHTEKDVVRALKYWERQKLLQLEFNEDKTIRGICLVDITDTEDYGSAAEETDSKSIEPANIIDASHDNISRFSKAAVKEAAIINQAVKDKTISSEIEQSNEHEYSLDQIKEFKKDPSIKELFFIIQAYLKQPLTTTDTNFVLFWYEELKFTTDLIEYLVEYSVSKGHYSLRYMDKIAIAWADSKITTVEQAKENSAIHSRIYYGVIKAFGITGRNLADYEADLTNKWSKEFGYDLDIIQEACKRTIAATHQPEFKYADSILSNWYSKGVKTMEDIVNLDREFNKSRKLSAVSSEKAAPAKKANKFVNFDQRKYDYEDLEKVLLTTHAQ